MPNGGAQTEQQRRDVPPGTTPPEGNQRKYEPLMDERRKTVLEQVKKGYDEFQETRTFKFPQWQYGEPKGKLFTVECEDCPDFGETAKLEFDSGRTAFLSIDWQVDFCGEKGYVDVMGYDLSLTARAIPPTQKALEAAREAGLEIVHAREGHLPDLSDAPYNKLLRSKIIGKGVGIGEEPEGGVGPLLVRGSRSWSIVEELEPQEGELIVDKAGKGALAVSPLFFQLRELGITHLVITGITTDVCVDTIMTQANDLGFWCLLLKDCTGATDEGNYESAVKMVKMQGGVFGWVADHEAFRNGLQEAGLVGGQSETSKR